MFLLTTPRLLLRPFDQADIEPFAAYRSDPEVARYQSWEAPYSTQQAAAFIAQLVTTQPGKPGEWYQVAIERKAQPGLIGDCAFHVFLHDPRQAEIGFTLAPQHQHQGYAREAVTRLLGYLFTDLNLHRITATCDALNHASAQLLERVGMRREAHYLEHVWFKGAWGSEYAYALLRREWETNRPAGSGN